MAATLGLTIGLKAAASRKPKGQTLLQRSESGSTLTPGAIPQADAAGEAPSTTAPEAEKPLWAIIPAVLPVPGGGGAPLFLG